MPYRDRVVIVTGGSRGIGEAIVRAFVAAGATVHFCDRRIPEGEALAAELTRTAPGQAAFSPADVTDPPAIDRWVDAITNAAGRLDCLVNNAGWHPPHRPIDGFSVADFRALLEINLIGTFTACRAALPHLRTAKGNIINIGSLVGTIGQRHAVTYAATKGAVIAFTKALAIDEAPHGVRVNSISPGNIATPLWTEGAATAPDPAQAEADGAAAQVLGRMGTATEVADLAVFLAARATFTTGVDHLLSGGAELGYGKKA